MNLDYLRRNPFNLDSDAISWVEMCFNSLTQDEKIRQLFTLQCPGNDVEMINRIKDFRPGGITRMMAGNAASERELIAKLNDACPTPLLVSADLEGSRMSLPSGAEWPNPLGLAAIDDIAVTEKVSLVMVQEARAAGINWSFTPVLDINHAFRSAIVATRGFGSDIDIIEKHAICQMEVFQKHGIAAAVKHWPGEGYDDRDQHLVTTVIPLSVNEWRKTFGRLYEKAISGGALSVMSAHIAFPAYIKTNDKDAGINAFKPASISHELTTQLLREDLGFNGLIVSDATPMAGLGSWSKRQDYLPELVKAGCDVILFSDDPNEDLNYLNAALEKGRLTWDRVDDAVIRQLAMKAALGLHVPSPAVPEVDQQSNAGYSNVVARRAPTLVKDVQNNLPLDASKHRRILIFSTGVVFPFFPQPLPFILPDLLKDSGFDVTIYEAGMDVTATDFDFVLYLFGQETLLTLGRINLDWLGLTGDFGAAMKRHWHDIPTAMISFGYPYMLYDAPRAPTYINAYSTTETTQRAVHDLLLGKCIWNEINPIDPFVGLEDARY